MTTTKPPPPTPTPAPASTPPPPTTPSPTPTPTPTTLTTTTLLPRQLTALALTALLYTAATPFTPLTWLTGPMHLSGTLFLDRLAAGLVLFSAFYFQWAIASLRGPAAGVVVSLPVGGLLGGAGGGGVRLREGRLERDFGEGGGVGSEVVVGVWRTGDYWRFAGVQAVVLGVAEFGGSETMRRLLMVGVVLVLWVVGWAATPARVKRWAWEHVKVYLFVLVLDELRNVGYGALQGVASGGQRRRRGRW
ncbi:uncharacterized protein B0H64DRAFT_324988 [Chaetomium fimeti]|uniref:Uncharacterized protein n=1 Tax=Chaetomium fimeti TaxID=1854472 RepID=A0AAE0LR06_9PEZI|nr:hypothetical protein B0H64DRAFT_324988 [Chaetomium fimeti]